MLPIFPEAFKRYTSVYPQSEQDTVANFWFWRLRNRDKPEPVVLISPAS